MVDHHNLLVHATYLLYGQTSIKELIEKLWSVELVCTLGKDPYLDPSIAVRLENRKNLIHPVRSDKWRIESDFRTRSLQICFEG